MSYTETVLADEELIRSLPTRLPAEPTIIFTDVDDTLTYKGSLPEETYQALYRLKNAGIQVVPVTGASAGWCDCLIKTWPIDNIIGENGALSMHKSESGIVSTHFVKDESTVVSDMQKLQALAAELTTHFNEIRYTQDQAFRLTDIAFDIGQAVTVDNDRANLATEWLNKQGVHAKRSSIHINVWIGGHSKASGATQWLTRNHKNISDCLFIGDSPNDESMFEAFPLSVGVANIGHFVPNMKHLPTFITKSEGGHGFVDMVDSLLGTK